MLSIDRKRIILMNPVRIDWKNKKHKEQKNKDYLNDWLNMAYAQMMDNIDTHNHYWNGVDFPIKLQFKDSSIYPLIKLIINNYVKIRLFSQKLFKGKKLTDEEFFEQIKANFEVLKLHENIDEVEFKKQLASYYEVGQKNLASNLKGEYSLAQAENKLWEHNINQYQEEESLIKFILQSEKGLALIELEYFRFDIPETVRNNIKYADDLKVFDNFYILYTDPDAKNIEVEVEVKKPPKDPIVFGVISGSTKLYYIDDWLSDYCKLTYKDILKVNQDTKLTKK